MEVVYRDESIIVCVKPGGVLSTDEPGGMPELVREYLGDKNACVRTVHRLDRVVSGLMLLALTPDCASELSRQIREGGFEKSYLAVVHGRPEAASGVLTDLLLRDRYECKTYVVHERGKNVQEAQLEYELLASDGKLSKLKIKLITGRTHQIRCQFASRSMPLVGDRKYGAADDDCGIALWSHSLAFDHPITKERLRFSLEPPGVYPWDVLAP